MSGEGKVMSMEVPWDHKILENKRVAEDLIGAATTAAVEKVRGRVSLAFRVAHAVAFSLLRCLLARTKSPRKKSPMV